MKHQFLLWIRGGLSKAIAVVFAALFLLRPAPVRAAGDIGDFLDLLVAGADLGMKLQEFYEQESEADGSGGSGGNNFHIWLTDGGGPTAGFYIVKNGVGLTVVGFDNNASGGDEHEATIPDYVTGIASSNLFITAICDGAFAEYPNFPFARIGKLNLGRTPTHIGVHALDIPTLKTIVVATGNTKFSTVNGVLFNSNKTVLIRFPQGKAGSYVVPSTVTNIADNAFYRCSGLTNLVIGAHVTSLGTNAFGSSGLKAVVFGGNAPANNGTAFAGANATVFYTEGTSGWGPTFCGMPTAPLGSFSYSAQNGAVTITGFTGNNLSASFYSNNVAVIPGTIDGLPVTAIAANAFAANPYFRQVSIANSITNIGTRAFYGCEVLSSISLGDGVLSIGDEAFHLCRNLSSVTFGTNLASIGSQSFYNCSALTNAVIPNNVTTIGSLAFFNTGLRYVRLPANTTNVAALAFGGCTRLWSFQVDAANPEFTSIDGALVRKQTGELVQFPAGLWGSARLSSGVKSVGDDAFSGCLQLTSLTFLGPLTHIGASAFFNCTSLNSIVIPSVGSIASQAFGQCPSLTTLNLGGNPPIVGFGSFGNSPVTVYYVPGASGWGETLADKPTAQWIQFDYITNSSGGVTLTAYKGYGPFFYISDYGAEVIIPSTINGRPVTALGDYLFAYKPVTRLVIPDSVTTIGNNVFRGCRALRTLSIPASVVTIGSEAFSDAWLNSVTFFGHAPATDGTAFNSSSAAVYYMPGTFGWGSTFAGRPTIRFPFTYSVANGAAAITGYTGTNTAIEIPAAVGNLPVTRISPGAFRTNRMLTAVMVPDSVTSIGDGAFEGCSALNYLTLSPNLVTIEAGAFKYSSLPRLDVPASVEGIGVDAFFGCSRLTNLTVNPASATYSSAGGVVFDKTKTVLLIYPGGLGGAYSVPDSVTNIAPRAFASAGALTSVILPASVTGIGTEAFTGCSQLIAFTVNAANPAFSSADGVLLSKDRSLLVLIPPGLTGSYTVHPTVTTIGANAFAGSRLSSVTLGTNVTSIGGQAFLNAAQLTSVELGRNVASIGARAFAGCNALTFVYFQGNAPANDGTAFQGNGNLTISHLTGTTGWTSSYGGVPASVIPLNYAINPDNTVTITGYIGAGGNVNIPFTIQNLPVRTIGERAFLNAATLATVTLPPGITDIQSHAFESSGVEGIHLPAGVTNLGAHAFANTRISGALTVPGGITEIRTNTFMNCSRLTRLEIGEGIISIAEGAFRHCGSLTNVIIPASVASIGDHAFEGCISLSRLDLMFGNVRSIGDYAFHRSGLRTLYFSSNLTNIGDYAFQSNRLETLEFPATLTTLGAYAFAHNRGTKPYYDFYYFDGHAPAPQTNATAFLGNHGVVVYQTGNFGWGTNFGGLPTYASPVAFSYTLNGPVGLNGKGSITITSYSGGSEITIPSIYDGHTVTAIGDNAFQNVTALTSVVIPNTVTSIGGGAFAGCTGLTNVVLPSSLASIGANAFAGCIGLQTLTLPDTLSSLGSGAFQNCSSLTSIYFQGSAPTSDGTALNGTNQAVVYYLPGQSGWGATFNGITPTMLIQFSYVTNGNSITITGYFGAGGSVTIPDMIAGRPVTAIADHAFEGRTEITGMMLPETLVSIGESAFKTCRFLTSIQLGTNVAQIGSSAFEESGLTSIALPDSLTQLNASVFQRCLSLATVTFGTNLTSIGTSSFSGCPSLLAITLPGSITSIGENAFIGSGLASVTIPGGTIGAFAFTLSPNLSSVVFGPNVTSIENTAFAGCAALKSVTIPASVAHLGEFAFSQCTNLLTAYFLGNAPTPDTGSAFFQNNKQTVVYYEPGRTGWSSTFGGVPTVENSFRYSIINGGLSVMGYSGDSTVLSIPAAANGQPVTALGNAAVPPSVHTIIIPDHITTLTAGAFAQARALTNILVSPANPAFTSIDGVLFSKSGQQLVCYPPGLKGAYALPNGVTTIGEQAFLNVHGLTSVILPSSVTTLSSGAFQNSGLTSVSIPGSVTSIGSYAFFNCTNLSAVYFSGNLPATDSTIFQLTPALTIYTATGLAGWTSTFPGRPIIAYATNNYGAIVDGSVTITGVANVHGSALTVPTVINGLPVNAIASRGFGSGVRSVHLGANILRLGNAPFWGSGLLTNITVDPANPMFSSTNGVLFNKDKTVLVQYPPALQGYAVPEGVTTIAPEAFSASGITTLTLPGSVTSIGSNAFENCLYLAGNLLLAPVRTIGNQAFAGCRQLSSVILGTNLSELGTNAFQNCYDLTSAYFPGDAPQDNGTAFSGSSAVIVYYEPNRSGWGATFGGAFTQARVPYGTLQVTIKPFGQNSHNLGAFWILDDSQQRFSGEVLTNLNLGQHKISFTAIPWYVTPADQYITVTANSTNLVIGTYTHIPFAVITNADNTLMITRYDQPVGGPARVEIPSYINGHAVTAIAPFAFQNQSDITHVEIPDTVKAIGSNAFYNAAQLTSVIIGNGVTNIGTEAFYGCGKLNQVIMGTNVSSIGDYAFIFCRALASVHLPASLTRIGAHAFGQSGLWHINVPDRVTDLGESAFGFCAQLRSVVIGSGIAEFTSAPFAGCAALTTAYFNGAAPAYTWSPFGNHVLNRVYYQPGTAGWASESYANSSTTAWPSLFSHTTNTDGTISITDYVGSGEANVVTPQSIHGRPVTAIADRALGFMNCESLVVSTGVRHIGNEAMRFNQASLMLLPDTLQTLGNSVFYSSRITSVTIPASVTSLGTGPFASCYYLTNFSVDAGNPGYTISGGILMNKAMDTLLQYPLAREGGYVIPDSVRFIADGAFSGTRVTEITIPHGVLGIGDNAFASSWLTSLTLPASVTNVGIQIVHGASDCTNIMVDPANPAYASADGVLFDKAFTKLLQYPPAREGDYNVPGTVTSISEGAFAGSVVAGVTLPNGLVHIGPSAFMSSDITSVTLPSGLTNIADFTFANCFGLTEIALPPGLVSIGEAAFLYCHNVQQLDLPASVRTIGASAFAYSGVAAIQIPEGVTAIEDSTFVHCTMLESVVLPESVTSIGTYAFFECFRLASIHLPSQVNQIGSDAFAGSHSLGAVSLPSGLISIADRLFDGCQSLATVNVPEGIVSIGEGAFRNCSSLEQINLPRAIRSIGAAAFQSTRLGTVTIPGGITTIQDFTFDSCGELSSVTLPESLTSIGANAFSECYALKSINLPVGLTNIAAYAFQSSGLTSVKIPYGITAIHDYTFDSCGSLTSITLPESITFIGANAFSGCYRLERIILPTSLTRIGDRAFQYSGLESLIIPGTVTHIGSDAFANNGSLWSVYILGFNPQNDGTAFRNSYDTIVYNVTNHYGNTTYGGAELRHFDPECDFVINSDGTATLTGTIQEGTVIIPSVMPGGWPVTGVAAGVFAGTRATTLYIPATVTNLADYALAYSHIESFMVDPANPAFTSVDGVLFNKAMTVLIQFVPGRGSYVLPATVTNLAPAAFSFPYTATGNSGGGDEEPPDEWEEEGGGGLKRLGKLMGGNSGIVNLTNLMVHPANPAFTSVGGVLFDKSKKLLVQYPYGLTGSYTVPAQTVSIGSHAFELSGIESVFVPEGITNIDPFAFASCHYLTNATLPSSLRSIQAYTFAQCEKLSTVTLPNSITNIGAFAFSRCSSLESIHLPPALVEIGDQAFEGAGLRSLVIPAAVTRIGTRAFRFSHGLRQVYFEGNVPDNDGTAFEYLYSVSVYFVDGATGWEDGSFGGAFAMPISSVVFSSSNPDNTATVTGTELTGVVMIPSMLNGKPVTGIAPGAFAGSEVTTLHIPSTVTNLADYALAYCGIQYFNVAPNNPAFMSADGALFNKAGTVLIQFIPGRSSYAIPASVTNIAPAAFAPRLQAGAQGFKRQTLARGGSRLQKTLGEEGLTSLTVDPANPAYSSVGGVIFDKSQDVLVQFPPGLTGEYIIPAQTVRIGAHAFDGCSLSAVLVPGGVAHIGQHAFANSSQLVTAYFEGNAPPDDGTAFLGSANASVWYRPGALAWGPTFGTAPTVALQRPVAAPITVVRTGEDLIIPVSDLATNWSDPNGTSVTLVEIATTTTKGLSLYVDDSIIIYLAGAAMIDNDQITYTIVNELGITNTGIINIVRETVSTVPANPALAVAFAAGKPTVQFMAEPNVNYAVQVSTNLTDWQTIWTTRGTSTGVIQFTDYNAQYDAAYYRVVCNP